MAMKISKKPKDTSADPLFDLVEWRRMAFIANINSLYPAVFKGQSDFADKLGISTSTLCTYLNNQTKPTVDFVIRCSLVLGKPIGELFRTPEEAEGPYHDIFDGTRESDVPHYLGNYLLYYFDTSMDDGGDRRYVSEVLCCAVISIHKSIENYARVRALMNLDLLKAEECLDMLNRAGEGQVEELYRGLGDSIPSATLYEGNFQVTTSFAYCVFRTVGSTRDIATLMLRHTKKDTAKKLEKHDYIGGLGALLSTSKGREAMPCIQLALVSRTVLHRALAEEALGQCLQLGKPKLDMGGQVDEVIRLVKLLYAGGGGEASLANGLSEEQKRLLIQNKLESLFGTALEQNIFRLRKVSGTEDDQVYHCIKEIRRQNGEEGR